MNPFQLVYDALWRMVNRNGYLLTLIPKYNRIDFASTPFVKENVSEQDFPELVLMPTGGFGEFRANSSSTRITKTYSFGIATANYNLTAQYEVVAWELFRSLVDWDVVLCSLQWPEDGRNFVTRASTLNIVDELITGENRGLHGWTGLWTGEVEMYFDSVDLRITE